jgi:hypothetical protein
MTSAKVESMCVLGLANEPIGPPRAWHVVLRQWKRRRARRLGGPR